MSEVTVLPPRWIRRVVLTPVQPLVLVLLLSTLPLWLIGAAIASNVLPGRWRGLRVLWFLLVYLLLDTIMLVRLLGLWVACGFGRHLHEPRWQDRHYAAMRRYLAALVAVGTVTFKVTIDVDLDDLHRPEGAARPPVLVFSRHAGPGDSFLLVHALLQVGYRPRIVLKDTLQWVPVIDIGLNRVPSFFVGRGAPRGTGTRAVSELAAGLGERDALVLFPEGRNYTPQRRLLSIAKLEQLNRHAEAEAAREMRHVLTPRTGGTLAALAGAPGADVVFVAHTGLEDFSSPVDLWRGMPMHATLEVKGWDVPRRDVPGPRPAAEAWLQWWWRRIDAWILERYGEQAVPDAVVEQVADAEVELPPD